MKDQLGTVVILAAAALGVAIGAGLSLIAAAIDRLRATIRKGICWRPSEPDDDDNAPGESTGLFPRLYDEDKGA